MFIGTVELVTFFFVHCEPVYYISVNMRRTSRRLVTYGKSTKRGAEEPMPLSDSDVEADLEPSNRSGRSTKLQRPSNDQHEPLRETRSLRPVPSKRHPGKHVIGQDGKGDHGALAKKKRSKLLSGEQAHFDDDRFTELALDSHEVPGFTHEPDIDSMEGQEMSSKSVARRQNIEYRSSRSPVTTSEAPSSLSPTTPSLRSPHNGAYLATHSVIPAPSEEVDYRSRSPVLSDPNPLSRQITPSRRRLIDSLGVTESRDSDHLSLLPVDESREDDVSRSDLFLNRDQNLPLKTKQDHMIHGRDSQVSSGTVLSRLAGSRVTYARQRSFLNDASTIEETIKDFKSQQGLGSSTDICHDQSYLTPEVTTQCADEGEQNDNMPVRSIHELRQAGENARFRETIDSIFEDIEDPYNQISGRCNSLIQLCAKLSEPHFARRFSEYGFDGRLVNCTEASLDIVSASLLLCAYRLVCIGGPFGFTQLLRFWPKLLEIAPPLLTTTDDILLVSACRSIGLSKAVQMSFKKIVPQLSSLIGDETSAKFSPQFLALSSMHSALSCLREKGKAIEPIPESLMDQIVQLVVSMSPRNSEFPLPPEQFRLLVQGFSVLEDYTALPDSLELYDHGVFEPLPRLHNFLCFENFDQGRQLLILYTRLILNITNNDPSVCNLFANTELISRFVDIVNMELRGTPENLLIKADSSLNIVILSLGALINITERSELSRTIFVESRCGSMPLIRVLLNRFSSMVDSVYQVCPRHVNPTRPR